MNIFSIYAHHEPSSLTSALKNVAFSTLNQAGHNLLETDLYGSGFSPKAEKYDFTTTTGGHFNYMLEQRNAARNGMTFAPDIISELEKLAQADILIIHTPIWWFSVPAVLKGWFDRVLAMGVAWDGGKIYENGLMRGKQVMICAVAGGPVEYYRPDGKHGATMNQILHPIHHGTFSFCGFDVHEPFVVLNSLGLNEAERSEVLKNYQFRIEHIVDSPSFLNKYS